MAPRILIFLIIPGAEYLSYVKSIATFALTFFGYIISVLASVHMDTSHLGLSKKLFDKIQKIIFEKIRKTIIVLYHPILKIGLKSSIIPKVDHQISKN